MGADRRNGARRVLHARRLRPAGSRLRLPETAQRVLRYAPAAAIMAIIVPDLAVVHGAVSISVENPRLVAGLVAFALAAGTRNILATIAGGMLVLTLIR